MNKKETYMKKGLLLVLFFLGILGVANGQIILRNSREVLVAKRVSMGVKFGVNDCKMYYTDDKIGATHNFSMRPAAGLYFEIPVARFFSISPEFMYIERGTKSTYTYGKNEEITVDYQFKARYFDFRVPFQFYWLISNSFKPYAFVAPDFGYVLGGRITMDQPKLEERPHLSCDVGSANISPYDLSLLMGVGFRFDIKMDKTAMYIKVEAAYNHGLMDTFSDKEKSDSPTSLNVNAYNVTGHRYNRGIEFMLSVGMPFYSKKGTCSYFERPSRW